jgi:hypothetical protein
MVGIGLRRKQTRFGSKRYQCSRMESLFRCWNGSPMSNFLIDRRRRHVYRQSPCTSSLARHVHRKIPPTVVTVVFQVDTYQAYIYQYIVARRPEYCTTRVLVHVYKYKYSKQKLLFDHIGPCRGSANR